MPGLFVGSSVAACRSMGCALPASQWAAWAQGSDGTCSGCGDPCTHVLRPVVNWVSGCWASTRRPVTSAFREPHLRVPIRRAEVGTEAQDGLGTCTPVRDWPALPAPEAWATLLGKRDCSDLGGCPG